jgi:hypothetical protein
MHVLIIEALKSKVLNCLVKTLELITLADHKYHINENIKQVRHQNGEIIIERPSEAIKALTSQSIFFVS